MCFPTIAGLLFLGVSSATHPDPAIGMLQGLLCMGAFGFLMGGLQSLSDWLASRGEQA